MSQAPVVASANNVHPDPATGSVISTSQVSAQPTIRTMIVCIPDDMSAQMLTAGYPAHSQFGGTATLSPRLWATPKLRIWQRRALFAAQRGRKGNPTVCAGGPVARLHLIGLRDAAGFHAALRWQQWAGAVAGTRSARPLREFEAEHLANPAKMSMAEARRRFYDQPRINAMRIFNEANYTAAPLDVDEVEMFQAGQQAYQSYHAMRALCGDALQTVTGRRIQPDSDSFADRITYLGRAMRIILNLPGTQRIAAIALH
jgi:hypothetical protein